MILDVQQLMQHRQQRRHRGDGDTVNLNLALRTRRHQVADGLLQKPLVRLILHVGDAAVQFYRDTFPFERHLFLSRHPTAFVVSLRHVYGFLRFLGVRKPHVDISGLAVHRVWIVSCSHLSFHYHRRESALLELLVKRYKYSVDMCVLLLCRKHDVGIPQHEIKPRLHILRQSVNAV